MARGAGLVNESLAFGIASEGLNVDVCVCAFLY